MNKLHLMLDNLSKSNEHNKNLFNIVHCTSYKGSDTPTCKVVLFRWTGATLAR